MLFCQKNKQTVPHWICVFNCQNYTKWEVVILHFLHVTLVHWHRLCALKCQTFIAGKSWKVTQNSEELIFSSHLLLMALDVKTLPPLSEPQSMTGSYLLPVCFSWTTSILTIQLSIFWGFFLHFMMSGNSTSEFKHWVYWFFVCWLRGLTSRLFFVPHLKVDAFVKLSRDQSIGHNHDQPWDGKQHQQDENVPTETSRKVNSFFCNKEYVLIPKKTRRDHR